MVLVWVMLSVAVTVSACGSKNQSASEATAMVQAESFEPDARFASIDTLAEFMIQKIKDQGTPENYIAIFDARSNAVASYWALNHKDKDQSQMSETVMKELEALANKLSEGSTLDMMQSGELSCAISQYLTAQDYCKLYRENPLYEAEMRDWLLLEDELDDFFTDLSYLSYWGGSITNVIYGGSMSNLANMRHADYCQLKKDGKYSGNGTMTIAEARANLIEEFNAAKSLEDDAIEDVEGYRKMLKDMRERADKAVALLDKWLESRAKLCEAENIPESHSAFLIGELARSIQQLMEG